MKPRIESLEPRRLLSGDWTTVDDFQLAAWQGNSFGANGPMDIVADTAGNVFAVGSSRDAAGVQHDVVRMRSSGSDQWTTISDEVHPLNYYSAAVSGNGDLYVAASDGQANHAILRMNRAAGETSFRQIGAPQTLSGFTVDATGNIYVCGALQVRTGGGYQFHWVVQKQTAGTGTFATVDDFIYGRNVTTGAIAMTIVPGGPGAGIYVVGDAHPTGNGFSGRQIVRKSTNGGISWTTTEDFLYDPATGGGSVAGAIAGDLQGNVYIAGVGNRGTLVGFDKKKQPIYQYTTDAVVRRSSNGGTSWVTDDVVYGQSSDVARDLAIAPSGDVYLASTVRAASGQPNRSIVRVRTAAGWHTANEFQLVPDKQTNMRDVAVDTVGNVFVAGYAFDASNTVHWLVRSPAATTTTAATFSETPIGFANSASSDDDPTLAEELFGAAA